MALRFLQNGWPAAGADDLWSLASRWVSAVPLDEFDFIIVGAGSAGCVLADRLSKSDWCSVLVIEAGGSDRRFMIRMPIGYGHSFYNPRVNWMYSTVPQPSLSGRSSYWPRGKVLGGSSSINAMVFVRGQRQDLTTGGRWAIPAGGGQTCYRTSGRSRISRERRRQSGEAAARFASSTLPARCIRSAKPSSMRRNRPVMPARPTIMARSKRASPPIRSRRGREFANPPRRRFSHPQCGGETSLSSPARW